MATTQPCATFRTRHVTFSLVEDGTLCALSRNADDRSYLAPQQPAPLLTVRVSGKLRTPERAPWDASAGHLKLRKILPR
ncbi:MAG TPA: hypothetical protein VI136_00505 [Verrucomicrobiae bacterium]